MRFSIQDMGTRAEHILRDLEWLRGALLDQADPALRAIADRLPSYTQAQVDAMVAKAAADAAEKAVAGLKTWTWKAGDGTERTFFIQ